MSTRFWFLTGRNSFHPIPWASHSHLSVILLYIMHVTHAYPSRSGWSIIKVLYCCGHRVGYPLTRVSKNNQCTEDAEFWPGVWRNTLQWHLYWTDDKIWSTSGIHVNLKNLIIRPHKLTSQFIVTSVDTIGLMFLQHKQVNIFFHLILQPVQEYECKLHPLIELQLISCTQRQLGTQFVLVPV